MKKKLLLMLTALLCAAALTFGLAACGGGDNKKASCTLVSDAEHVIEVQIKESNGATHSLGRNGVWSIPKQIEKDKECIISVFLDTFYEVGGLKISVNGTEKTLTGSNSVYSCTYTPTADFTVTLSGAAKLETTSVVLNKMDWQPCYDYFSGTDDAVQQGDAFKAALQSGFRIELLVNDEQKGLLTLGELSGGSREFKINKSDKIEIRLYTEGNFEISYEGAINIDYQAGADVIGSVSADKKRCTAKIDTVINSVSVSVQVGFIAPLS